MAGASLIVNPSGALGAGVTDYRTGQDVNGHDLHQGQGEVYSFRADATILKGQALGWVVPTATVPLSVTPMAAATSALLYAGAAGDGAAVGETVTVIRRGVAVVRIGADAPAGGNGLLSPDTTTGEFEAGAAAVGNQIVGVVLGPEIGTTGTCLAFLDPTLSVEEV